MVATIPLFRLSEHMMENEDMTQQLMNPDNVLKAFEVTPGYWCSVVEREKQGQLIKELTKNGFLHQEITDMLRKQGVVTEQQSGRGFLIFRPTQDMHQIGPAVVREKIQATGFQLDLVGEG